MGEHHALGVAGGAAGVDERREVLAAAAFCASASNAAGSASAPSSIRLVERAHAGRRRLAVDADQDVVLHRRHLRLAPRAARRAARAPCANTHLGAAVVDDVGRLLGQQRRVDRHVHGAGAERREVDRRPVRAVLGHHRHPVAARHAEPAQRLGQRPHPDPQLLGRDRHVLAADLVQQTVGLACPAPPGTARIGSGSPSRPPLRRPRNPISAGLSSSSVAHCKLPAVARLWRDKSSRPRRQVLG